MQVLVVLNPVAGGGRAGRLAARLGAWLVEHAPHAILAQTDGADMAVGHIARLPPRSRVVVVGGDGTVNTLLPALLAGEHSLGLVAAGSGNDLARALGLPRHSWRRSIEHAVGAPALSSMDLGRARWWRADGESRRTRHFMSSWTAGFDAAIVRRADLGPRRLRGLPRYVLATLREVAALAHHRFEIRVDAMPARTLEGLFCSVLNTPSFGSGMPAVPHARIDDARLDLLEAGALGRAATLALLPRLLWGRHLRDPRVSTQAFECLEVRLEAGASVPIAADGEFLGEALGFEIDVLPGALRVAAA